MNSLRYLRYIYPASLDTRSYSCLTRLMQQRCFAQSSVQFFDSNESNPNKNFKVNPVFINRNPRCLEQAGIAPKRLGWRFQSPTRTYYYKLTLDVTNTHTTGKVEHQSGQTVVSATTAEFAIKQQLNSYTDKLSAYNIGRLLAKRCLEAGITRVFYDSCKRDRHSQTIQTFLKALRDNRLVLHEQVVKLPNYSPGIDYQNSNNRLAEVKKLKDDYQFE